jgi:hypothetical protein
MVSSPTGLSLSHGLVSLSLCRSAEHRARQHSTDPVSLLRAKNPPSPVAAHRPTDRASIEPLAPPLSSQQGGHAEPSVGRAVPEAARRWPARQKRARGVRVSQGFRKRMSLKHGPAGTCGGKVRFRNLPPARNEPRGWKRGRLSAGCPAPDRPRSDVHGFPAETRLPGFQVGCGLWQALPPRQRRAVAGGAETVAKWRSCQVVILTLVFPRACVLEATSPTSRLCVAKLLISREEATLLWRSGRDRSGVR